MQDATSFKQYRRQVRRALDNTFQREALDRFAVAYRTGRANAFSGVDIPELVAAIAAAKDAALDHLEELLRNSKPMPRRPGPSSTWPARPRRPATSSPASPGTTTSKRSSSPSP